MFFVFKRKKGVILAVLSAFALTALTAVIISFCFSQGKEKSEYSFDLNQTSGTGGFLAQFDLEYDSQKSKRQLTLPQKDDELFCSYADFQSKLGFNVLKFAGKRVEERYLKLKNKTEKAQSLYAVMYIYKERVIAVHLTTLEQDSELLPITAFV